MPFEPSPIDAAEEDLPRTLPIRVFAGTLTQEVPQGLDFCDLTDTPMTMPLAIANRPPAPPIDPLVTPPGGIPREAIRSAEPIPAQPKLRVLRGQRVNVDYPLFEGVNYLGRMDDEPVHIDLSEQEASDRIWASRRHAAIYIAHGFLQIEDLHSRNGTFLNRLRIAPGTRRTLNLNDVIQIGSIQMRVTI